MESVVVTPRGLHLLKKELEELVRVRRPAISKAIAEAREHGDLKENSEYHAAREEQSFVEARIKYIEGVVSSARLIDLEQIKKSRLNSSSDDQDVRVVFGSLVVLSNLNTGDEVQYRIVGEDEADVKKGRLSVASPIARGIIGKEVGDIAKIETPAGIIELQIEEVTYNNEPIDAE